MHRIRPLLLLLPLLAGCATPRHAAPNLADVPIPALSAAGALDSGKVTPIQKAIVVKYAPYPTASFERLMRATGTRPGETISLWSRMTGTTSATSSGDLVEINFAVADAHEGPNTHMDARGYLLPKGTKITVVVEPFGLTKNISVSVPPSSGSRAGVEEIEQEIRREFSDGLLPEKGLHQGETLLIDMSVPATSTDKASTLKGKAVVQGQGTYRGRPVIVCEVTGVIVAENRRPLGMHSYKFLDTATGIWSHTETVVEGQIVSGATTDRLEAHYIDDVRF